MQFKRFTAFSKSTDEWFLTVFAERFDHHGNFSIGDTVVATINLEEFYLADSGGREEVPDCVPYTCMMSSRNQL